VWRTFGIDRSNTQVQPVAVALVQLRAVAREAMAVLLSQRGLKVIGTFARAKDLLQQPPEGKFVLIFDHATANRDGLEVMSEVRAQLPQAKVLMYNVPDRDEAIVQCARAGARACMVEDVSVEGLIAAIRSLAEGTPSATPRVITSLFSHIAGDQGEAKKMHAGLTKREEEVLELIVQGYSNKEIAALLFLQHQTVKNHVRAIFSKLEIHNRFEVVRSQWLGAKQ
jgi:DNA-binding NarL/FixJ family response regulator